jgi:hypothetical protein
MNEPEPFSKVINKKIRLLVWTHMFKSSFTILYIFTVGYIVWCTIVLVKVGVSPFLFLLPFIILLGVYAYSIRRSTDVLLKEFAQVNNYDFYGVGDPRLLEGSVFKQGHSHRMKDVVKGTFTHHPFTLFVFEYAVGEGHEAREYASTILELDLAKPLPHTVLVSKYHQTNNSLADFTSLAHTGGLGFPMSLDGKQTISLEGTFYKYFDVYIDQGYELETLEILTPDMMEELINNASQFSIEIIDDKIYIVFGEVVTDLKELEAMYSVAKKLSEKIAFFLEKKDESWLLDSLPTHV